VPVPRANPRHIVTLLLDGITADDYLQWVRDPDSPEHDELALIDVGSAAGGDRIRLELLVEDDPPPPSAAAQALGFPITPEVVAITCAEPARRCGGQDNLEKGERPWGR
jgi:hypothetical protein